MLADKDARIEELIRALDKAQSAPAPAPQQGGGSGSIVALSAQPPPSPSVPPHHLREGDWVELEPSSSSNGVRAVDGLEPGIVAIVDAVSVQHDTRGDVAIRLPSGTTTGYIDAHLLRRVGAAPAAPHRVDAAPSRRQVTFNSGATANVADARASVGVGVGVDVGADARSSHRVDHGWSDPVTALAFKLEKLERDEVRIRQAWRSIRFEDVELAPRNGAREPPLNEVVELASIPTVVHDRHRYGNGPGARRTHFEPSSGIHPPASASAPTLAPVRATASALGPAYASKGALEAASVAVRQQRAPPSPATPAADMWRRPARSSTFDMIRVTNHGDGDATHSAAAGAAKAEAQRLAFKAAAGPRSSRPHTFNIRLPPGLVTDVASGRARFRDYVHRTAICDINDADPWKLTEKISELILNKLLKGVASEIGGTMDGIVDELVKTEGLETGGGGGRVIDRV